MPPVPAQPRLIVPLRLRPLTTALLKQTDQLVEQTAKRPQKKKEKGHFAKRMREILLLTDPMWGDTTVDLGTSSPNPNHTLLTLSAITEVCVLAQHSTETANVPQFHKMLGQHLDTFKPRIKMPLLKHLLYRCLKPHTFFYEDEFKTLFDLSTKEKGSIQQQLMKAAITLGKWLINYILEPKNAATLRHCLSYMPVEILLAIIEFAKSDESHRQVLFIIEHLLNKNSLDETGTRTIHQALNQIFSLSPIDSV